MFLDYLSLVILLMGLTVVFYTFIYIHDLPHKIAKQREHPHEEAIHVACWLSLFTLHAMWPLVFTWAVSHKTPAAGHAVPTAGGPEGDLSSRLAAVEARLKQLDSTARPDTNRE
jgi:Na+/H+ antiporter NhaD/arsenite permease-like protein